MKQEAKRLRYLSFTDKGYALALKLAHHLGGEASRCGGISRCIGVSPCGEVSPSVACGASPLVKGETSRCGGKFCGKISRFETVSHCGGVSHGGSVSPLLDCDAPSVSQDGSSCNGEIPHCSKISRFEGEPCYDKISLKQWTAENFRDVDVLVYVGACGIAVRAIAPHLNSKTSDPAVVVVDEGGQFAISLVSGHLGGGNDFARAVAEACGAIPVITTATDVNGVFAVDEWAKRQNCHISNPGKIKVISSALLGGGRIGIKCFAEICGNAPQGVRQVQDKEDYQVLVDFHTGKDGERLKLVPRIAVLGVGCRRGTNEKQLEGRFQSLLAETDLAEEAFCQVATIDLKKNEPGLTVFCQNHGLPLVTYSSETLAKAAGAFSASAFVKDVTGVDNVCERSAALASGGTLYCRKRSGNGITMAVALAPYAPDWRWKDE